ncbi:MAG: pyruvate dehydrogenase (acetyl-transferring), homodimeric type [Candidatus Poseidoniaceae archaeon]|jgi:pyruvate dehydrogenase E1 component|nr:pyruvate dehydrogenase (acetyl-transferring), homodimeric type [Candidatus Poseidoniaceae archaeon]
MNSNGFHNTLPDPDPEQTLEWQESIRAVSDAFGPERARRLLLDTLDAAGNEGIDISVVNTPYLNTIPISQQPTYPGDIEMEKRLHGVLSWNAMMMVTRANKANEGIGGHISTYASNSHLWEVGQNHYYRGKDLDGWGDHVYWQGHASPGIYARAWLEGRLTLENIENFRQECGGEGLSSYPHPRLMPDFWEHPSVSMGLGAMTAIHTARFNRYLSNRGLSDTSNSRVWYTMGDGESDEPESLSQLSLAGREGLDNIIMVVNCNLQRLDGPVRGNSKIVQELEGSFRGAGWNVIKILWGSMWDDLFARDSEGRLAKRLEELVDGDEQRIFTSDSATFRKEVFNSPELKAMVSHLDDDALEALAANLGGHDVLKINAAYAAAEAENEKPTVILARTIKGHGLGPAFAGRNSTHGKKKADEDSIKWMCKDLGLSFTDAELKKYPYILPEDVPEVAAYAKERRSALGGPCPERRTPPFGLTPPGPEGYSSFDEGTKGKMQVSSTTAFVRILRSLMKDENIGKRIVPIIPDEGRTFGMDPLFAEFGIYHPEGQKYTPVDHKMIMKYKESEQGQLLQEGINEAGAMSTFIASATSYSTQGCPTIPFYIFYSMFGFQRIGDLVWSAADQRARGFMIGATSGRTTLNGEGLQHQDGQSLLMAHTNPAVRAYDPAFAYELATIIRNGINEMAIEEKDLMYYIAVYNENHPMPPKPEGTDEGIVKGLYRLRKTPDGEGPIVRLVGSGPIMLQLFAAVEALQKFGVRTEIWSATSYGELRREGLECERTNRLNPGSARRVPYVEQMLGDGAYPTVSVSDNLIAVPDLIRQWVGGEYTVLGTDGFGRSDTRPSLRRHFEIDAEHITLAALSALVRAREIDSKVYEEARKDMGVSRERNDITSL